VPLGGWGAVPVVAGGRPLLLDAAAVWNARAPIVDPAVAATSLGMGPLAPLAAQRTVYGCYFDQGGTGSGTAPRLAQANQGWVFPKAEQATSPPNAAWTAATATAGDWGATPWGSATPVALPTAADANALLGTNKCGNYEYDGPYADIPRAAQETDQWPGWGGGPPNGVAWLARRRPE